MNFRRLLSSLALTALLVAPAAAQNPFNVDFQFTQAGSFDNYGGTITGGGYTGNFFQVFCVNPDLFVRVNEVYADAWATPFTSGNDSHVINPNATTWNSSYVLAARIASFGLGGGLGDPNNWQYAIWTAMGFDMSGRGDYNATAVADWITLAQTNAGDIFPNQWMVITNAGKNRQEFIVLDPDRPQEVVPEPATMTLLATGLAGMAAARRRKKKV